MTAMPHVAEQQAESASARSILSIRGLKKYYEIADSDAPFSWGRARISVRAVDSVSFDVVKGEILGVVGESGCGKSTLARLLVGLLQPDSGAIALRGSALDTRSRGALKLWRKAVQMVFQDSYSSLNPRLAVLDSIAYGPRVHGVKASAAVERARLLLAQVGMRPGLFGHRYPHELSGGQRQRVNIARALAIAPEVLILDEAVSALDKSVGAQVLNLLHELKRQHDLTYVFISHDLDVVQYFCDRVVVMYLGRIVEVGSAESIYAAPAHPYTRSLLASRVSMDPAKRVVQAQLTGDPPNPINLPSGCRFRSRCPNAAAKCEQQEPELLPSDAGEAHRVACHFPVNAEASVRMPPQSASIPTHPGR